MITYYRELVHMTRIRFLLRGFFILSGFDSYYESYYLLHRFISIDLLRVYYQYWSIAEFRFAISKFRVLGDNSVNDLSSGILDRSEVTVRRTLMMDVYYFV